MKNCCKNGHPYPENAYVRGNGKRFCKRCGVEAKQRKRRAIGIPRIGERQKLNVPRTPVPANTNEVGYIPLTQGRYSTVDIADYPLLIQNNWQAVCLMGTWYAQRTDKNGKRLAMHQSLIGRKNVDHRDHDGLNNRRSNLRPASNIENSRNTRLYRNSTTGFKGVSLDRGRLRARINVNGKSIHLGHFNDVEQAALAYDAAARRHFGDFACLNF